MQPLIVPGGAPVMIHGMPQPSASQIAGRIAVGRWLAAWAVTVFLIVLVGGGTRLTESGLSITEWKPISGIIPPLSAADWDVEFGKYKLIPQYTQMNAGMTLAEFKGIFLWEYFHRLLARVGGLVFAIPFFWFALRKRVPRVEGGIGHAQSDHRTAAAELAG